MSSVTFTGVVHGGHLHVPIAEFEGKEVRATLTVADAPAANSAVAADVADEAEILEDCGRIKLPPREGKTVKFRFIKSERRPMRAYANDDCEIWDD
jgi:hypothetical protein